MITRRDREIINFIERIGFITIEQCSKLYFSDSNYSYDLARKRLKKITLQADYIKPILNCETKQTVYIPKYNNIKRVSKHDLLVVDYLAELKILGAEVEVVEVEKDFGGVIPDMYLVFRFNGYRYYQFIEVQLRHDYVDVNRYSKVMDTILIQTNNTIPKLVIIQNTNKDYTKDNITDMEIVHLKVDLEGIAKVLL